jgi:predicted RNA methylase
MTPEAIERAAQRNRALRSGMIARLRPMMVPAREAAKQFRSVADGVESVRSVVKQVESCKHVPGFFPTPRHLVARMIEEAGDLTGKTVLEPSAGNGAIAKEARKAGAAVSCVEYNCTLANILRQDGFDVENGDFMECQPKPFDLVLMNPPFERGADALHVMHAFKFLREGGKLVAIMGESSFFRSDRAAVEFRDWLESVGGTSEQLPDGTFSGADAYRSTGVQTRIVMISA